MKTLSVKKYNALMTARWCEDWKRAIADGRHHTCLPQLAFYVFNQKYGFVAFDEKTALWAKTKKQVQIDFNNLILQRKIRGW